MKREDQPHLHPKFQKHQRSHQNPLHRQLLNQTNLLTIHFELRFDFHAEQLRSRQILLQRTV